MYFSSSNDWGLKKLGSPTVDETNIEGGCCFVDEIL